MSESFDALVAGGGPAGAAAAITLARAGRSTCLVEATRYEAPRIGEHIGPRAAAALSELGVWDGIEQTCTLPCPAIHSYWGGAEQYARDYLFDPGGTGWQLDRARFDRELADRAERAGVAVLLGCRLRNIVRRHSGWVAITGPGAAARSVHAKLVVDATGRAAFVARRIGATRRYIDHLVSVGAWLEEAADPDLALVVEACENGWWYSAPIPGRRGVGMFLCDPGFLKTVSWKAPAAWKSLMTEAPSTSARLGGAVIVRGPMAFRADSAILKPIAGPGWLATGDAAMSMDPLSAHGITRAVRSGMAAGVAALRWLDGDSAALDHYAATQSSALQSYLLARTRTYREEPRWPTSQFWRRRHLEPGAIFLSPEHTLTVCGPVDHAGGIPGFGEREIGVLCGLCARGAPARSVVRGVLDETPGLNAEQVIFALQDLVLRGVLACQA